MKRAPYYVAALIGGYLLVVHYQGASSVASSGGNAFSTVIKTLQGR